MTRRRAAAVALVLAAAACAFADGSGDGERAAAQPELPLGPWARAGRPVLVRVPGALRVRGGGSPWALPQGAAFDEFLLHAVRADVTLRDLEIDDGGGRARRTARLELRPLSAGAPVRAVFAGTPDAGEVRVPAERLPTVAEAWLLFDEVDDPPDALHPAARAALDAWRAGPRPGTEARAGFQPLTASPGGAAFAAAAEVAAGSPHLPRDVGLALVVTAVAELAVLALAARRSRFRRAAWLAAGPAACLVWLVAGARLPGAVRATLFRLDGPADRLVVLRLESPRGGTAAFRVPADAGAPAVLRFDADDRSGEEAEVGREVRVTIPAGQSRLLAWRMPADTDATVDDRLTRAAVSPAVDAWLRSLGLEAHGAAPAAPVQELEEPRGFRVVRGGALRVGSRASARK